MAVSSIRNKSGTQLELWDSAQRLAFLANGEKIENLSTAISRVKMGEVSYPNKRGDFMNGSRYAATYIPPSEPRPAMVVFTGILGAGDVVTFT